VTTASPVAVSKPAVSPVARRDLVVLALVGSLLLTGAAGLIYQVVWFRVLGLVFGVTVHATSAVLAAFMGGLALGSFLAARWADRVKNPLLVYGVVEAVIGVLGLLSLPALSQLQPLYRTLALAAPDNILAVSAIRFVLALAIMLLPTTLMGLTLPLVVRGLTLRNRGLGTTVSLLYAANTFGAIAGAFLAGFVLIGGVGVPATVWIAASLNLIVGLLWTIVGLVRPVIGEDAPERTAPETRAPEFRVSSRVATAVLWSYAVSGFVALAYEVVWTRVLAGILPSTVYAFTLMLCSILSGIALGSWAVNPFIGRRWNWLRIYVGLEILIAALALASIAFMSQATRIEAVLLTRFPGTDFLLGKPVFMAPFTLLAIFPVAFVMGMTFPVATLLYDAGRADVGRRVGSIYGANVLGGVTGSLAAGLLLIPALGAQGTMLLLSAGNVAAGLGVAIVAGMPVVELAGFAVAGLLVLLAGRFWSPNLYAALSEGEARGIRTIWMHEGQDANVSVVRTPEGLNVLKINSQGMGASGGPQAAFHHRLGHIGPLIHPNPEELLIVGLGVGATAGASAIHPELKVTVVELIEGVVAAAPYFEDSNYGLLDLPNVSIQIDDGRNFLLLSDRKFDVIESDPILPRNAGAANLYSADFYRLVRGALNEDGIFVQWIDPTLPRFAHRLMVRTFLDVFPGATMWENGSVLVGSTKPIVVPPERIASRLQASPVRDAAAADGIKAADDVLLRYVGGPAELRHYAGPGPIMTDDRPMIEYYLTLPSDGPAPDLRWLPAARYLADEARPGDAIIFSDPSFNERLSALPLPAMTGLTLPADTTFDNVLEGRIRTFAEGRRRVWFVPSPINPRDAEIADLLGRIKQQVGDAQHVLVRTLVYE
jgi:spermidine synthase